MQFWQFLGDLHPRLVQFPLVLLLAGLLFDLCGLLLRSDRLHFAAKLLSMAGTFFLLIAFICGIYAEIWAGRAGIPQEQIEWHELMANIASWGFVVLMAWRLFLNAPRRKQLTLYVAIGLAWYVLLIITGYFGGKLVFDYGAAVVGARANDVLALHDLNVLATRQTDLNLQYSEWMHHIFGWLTFALSGSLFASALFPRRADKLKWIGPTLFLLGGIFLFFFADLDLYPHLTDLRQLRDREVQLHKTLAIILAIIGAVGFRRLKKQSAAAGSSVQAKIKNQNSKISSSTVSKLVAVMALIGGGMLFTHVHTVAPYANVAAGVYIAHITLGLVALGIGGARLLQDAAPRYRNAFAVLFAGLMCVESVLLITYNEGLPWYIGYGHYKRWGMTPGDNGTIAPYGPIRAELTFNPKTQQMDLYTLARMTDDPAPVVAKNVDVLISRGYSEIAVSLGSVDDSPSAWHFSAKAPFLENAPAFCARAALPIEGSMKMGYFDPWVTDLIKPIPPNETPQYQCPMHDGIVSETPGTCPLCGMPLVPYQRYPRTTLHDADYDMRLDISSSSPSLGTPGEGRGGGSTIDPEKPATLRFTPLHNGQILRDLAVVHEHLLHLIVVSSDLEFFDHVHPILQSDGSLTLDYAFPHAGNFLLFADITPNGQRSQVFRLPITVGEKSSELLVDDPPLTVSPTLSKSLPDDPTMTAELIFQPRTPQSGLHTDFLFRLTKDGRPVNDLEPYIGAMGHVVSISQDTGMYLHCHPEQLLAPTPDARGGPDIPFHTVFPHPGTYKIWGQFKRNNKVVIADFVVNVKAPILPPALINFLLND